jgi:hypothetical protein
MMNINYALSVNFNYDPDRDVIIETRCVKRRIDTCIQFLKADIKTLERSFVPFDLYQSVRNRNFVSFELELSDEEINEIMEHNYDLFQYKRASLNKTDNQYETCETKLN